MRKKLSYKEALDQAKFQASRRVPVSHEYIAEVIVEAIFEALADAGIIPNS